jgi:hypothetical protein
MKLPRLDRPGRYYLPAGTKLSDLEEPDGGTEHEKQWCPGYGKCAVAAKGAGREVAPGMCHWCEQNPGKPRPPVRGRVQLEWIRIVDAPASAQGGQT